MGRTVELQDIRAAAYKRADAEGAVDRFPPAEVDGYINEGGPELWDLLIEARGRSFCRKEPSFEITTTADTDAYDLPSLFYKLISVRVKGDGGEPLHAFTPQEEAYLRDASALRPLKYDLRPTKIALLPLHAAGLTIVLDYVPAWTDLVDNDDTFDGINGWEVYLSDYAAKKMAAKDEDWELVRLIDSDMTKTAQRIAKLAPNRDGFRPERVKDVRGGRRPPFFGRRF